MKNHDDEYEVVAAIVAALKYHEGNDTDFEIKSIKKIDDTRKWFRTGRNEVIEGRQQLYLRKRRPL